jgi:hypothetical protein
MNEHDDLFGDLVAETMAPIGQIPLGGVSALVLELSRSGAAGAGPHNSAWKRATTQRWGIENHLAEKGWKSALTLRELHSWRHIEEELKKGRRWQYIVSRDGGDGVMLTGAREMPRDEVVDVLDEYGYEFDRIVYVDDVQSIEMFKKAHP